MIGREQITGAILAGGRGRRMEGVDKGLMPFRGRPLVTYVIDAIKPQAGSLILNANRHEERYAALGFPVVADHETGFAGPLAGIARVLEQAVTPYVLVVPCDMPFLPPQLAARLSQAMLRNGAQAAVARGAGRLQPLCVLLERSVDEDLRRFRESGDAKAQRWLLGLSHVVVDFPGQAAAFRNINTPADLMTEIA